MKIAFHSYKGGVGRTKVMVGTAALLAMKGYRVCLLDFDLDASGLSTMFRSKREDINGMELLNILSKGNLSLTYNSIIDVSNLLFERFGVRPIGNGCLNYIPTISDPKLSDQIQFSPSSKFLVDALLDEILQNCGIDLLLIDLRPGFSPASSLILPRVDCAVIVTRLDRQNIEGLSQIVPFMKSKNLDLIQVANMVPDNPLSSKRIEEISSLTNQRIDVVLKYDPDLIFEDDFECVAKNGSPMQLGLEALADQISSRSI